MYSYMKSTGNMGLFRDLLELLPQVTPTAPVHSVVELDLLHELSVSSDPMQLMPLRVMGIPPGSAKF